MVESKEKALAPFLGRADALWVRVNAADSDGNSDGNIADDVLLSNITVEDIGEEQQIQTQMPQQQMPKQLSNYQPTLNNQIPVENFEPAVETPKHNYGQKVNEHLEELQASLFYQP